MLTFSARHVLRDLVHLYLDELNPSSALCGIRSDLGVDAWIKIVPSFIKLNLQAKLMELSSRKYPTYSYMSPSEIEALLIADVLEATSPFETGVLWPTLYFDGTKKLEVLMRNHHLNDWSALHREPTREFLDELTSIYNHSQEGQHPIIII